MSHEHILVAEDDPNIRRGLVDTLESEGYEVSSVANGKEALHDFHVNHYDMVILDIMMPEMNGYDVCRHIRKEDSHVPILFLSAKSEEIDKVLGLELGADDYIAKPFGVHELLARIAAILRRSRRHLAEETQRGEEERTFAFGEAIIDRRSYELKRGNAVQRLTAKELGMLEYFHAHPGEAVSRDELLNAIWGIDYQGTTRTLDQHIAQLRKKVEPDPENPSLILTVHGVGYKFGGPTPPAL